RRVAVEGGDESLRGERGQVVGPVREIDAQRVVGAEVAVGGTAADVALVVGGGGEGAVGERRAADRGGGVDREGAAQPAAAGLQVTLPVGLGGQLHLELDLRRDDALDVADRVTARRGRGGGRDHAGTCSH